MGGGLTKAAIAMVDDDPALTAVIQDALPQTVALLAPAPAAPTAPAAAAAAGDGGAA